MTLSQATDGFVDLLGLLQLPFTDPRAQLLQSLQKSLICPAANGGFFEPALCASAEDKLVTMLSFLHRLYRCQLALGELAHLHFAIRNLLKGGFGENLAEMITEAARAIHQVVDLGLP